MMLRTVLCGCWVCVVLGLCWGCASTPGPAAFNAGVGHSDASPPPKKGPKRLFLVEKPLVFQGHTEPYRTAASFEFDLPRPPRRARLVLVYRGVPGATSEDYTMGRFRHKVELNGIFLMDLNTHADNEDQLVSYTKWISVKLLRRQNVLRFVAGDDGKNQVDEFSLHKAVIEFDW